jgi:hypothetical protein
LSLLWDLAEPAGPSFEQRGDEEAKDDGDLNPVVD